MSNLPGTTTPGPCRSGVTFACQDVATVTRINPLAMLPGSEIPAEYVRICQPCYDTLADIYAASALPAPVAP